MDIKSLLEAVKNSTLSIETAEKQLKSLPFNDMGFALLDTDRKQRTGFSEVIFCQGKTTEQVIKITSQLSTSSSNVLGTRATNEQLEKILIAFPSAQINYSAKTFFIRNTPLEKIGSVCVITAGTSDIPVAEEAAVTAECFGCDVSRVFDVGVAGIHRLFAKLDIIREANVVIAIAGMEGALASVVGGLVERPVIAVPTSVGYGASFNGLSALLTMLNSCSAGISVVNIDNGFGAGYLAGQINRLVFDKTKNLKGNLK